MIFKLLKDLLHLHVWKDVIIFVSGFQCYFTHHKQNLVVLSSVAAFVRCTTGLIIAVQSIILGLTKLSLDVFMSSLPRPVKLAVMSTGCDVIWWDCSQKLFWSTNKCPKLLSMLLRISAVVWLMKVTKKSFHIILYISSLEFQNVVPKRNYFWSSPPSAPGSYFFQWFP